MDEGYQWLQSIADRMKDDVGKGAAPTPEQLTVRQLLQRFGYQRRGDWINSQIRNGLEKFKLQTDQMSRLPGSIPRLPSNSIQTHRERAIRGERPIPRIGLLHLRLRT